AVRWFRMAAENSNNFFPASSEINLGEMYEHGRGVGRDCREALRWYRLVADESFGHYSERANEALVRLRKAGYG
ncbi:MAG: hypothetical protein ACRERV_03700, partial [Methylococcales bacterium]